MKVKGLLLLLFLLIILVLAGFIGSQNSHIVLVNYLLGETQLRMSAILGGTFFLGFLVSTILLVAYVVRLKWQVKTLERKNKKLTKLSDEQ